MNFLGKSLPGRIALPILVMLVAIPFSHYAHLLVRFDSANFDFDPKSGTAPVLFVDGNVSFLGAKDTNSSIVSRLYFNEPAISLSVRAAVEYRSLEIFRVEVDCEQFARNGRASELHFAKEYSRSANTWHAELPDVKLRWNWAFKKSAEESVDLYGASHLMNVLFQLALSSAMVASDEIRAEFSFHFSLVLQALFAVAQLAVIASILTRLMKVNLIDFTIERMCDFSL